MCPWLFFAGHVIACLLLIVVPLRSKRVLRPDFAYAELEGGARDSMDKQAWSRCLFVGD